ncbi:MAG TPA: M81 family metallopeptidase [Acidimicrobiia bacterium]|nr:M81 family metallopeptidase [Acidimicrobiia bacterium]
MRIATLGLSHESNTYAPVHATLDRWLAAGPVAGEALVAEFANSNATLGGYLEAGDADRDVDVVPLLFFRLTPMNAITSEAFEHMVGGLLDALREQGPWDAVLLALHGAAVSEGYRDADGEILHRVRLLVGEDVPIGVSLDMHANISQKMVDNATIINTYMTNPHLDPRPRARRVADLIIRTVRGEIQPMKALEMPPLAINILRQGTSDSPMKELVAFAAEQAARPGVLSVSTAEGFPYADVEEMGMAFIAITDGDQELADDVARRLVRAAWDARSEMAGEGSDIDEALLHAAAATEHPVVLLDVGDNVGGGSPGDSTHVLAAAQRLGVGGLFQSFCDPAAAEACMAAGVGATVELEVGGKTDDLHGSPVSIRGTVRVLDSGKFEDPGTTHGGFRFFDTGRRAVVHTEDGQTLLLESLPLGNPSLQQLISVGINPHTQPIIVAKGVHSPRGAFEPIAAEMIWLNTPGCTSADLSTLEFRHRRRPMFPFEADTEYQPG